MIDFKIKVTGRVVHFKSDSPLLVYDPFREKEFRRLICRGSQGADVVFDIRYGAVPEFREKEALFESERWSLSRYKDKFLFEYPDRYLKGRIERAAEVEQDMAKGVIYLNREKTPGEEEESERQQLLRMTDEERRRREGTRKRRDKKRALGPLEMNEEEGQRPQEAVRSEKSFGLDQKEATGSAPILIQGRPRKGMPERMGQRAIFEIKANFFQAFLVEYLIRQRIGFLVHCSSVYDGGKLHLFMGKAEAGKSTIAEFWHRRAKATVFNDDRAVITARNKNAYFYNAPWVGTLTDKCDLGLGDGTQVSGIFFIYQAASNRLKRLNRVEAASRIFQNSFPVFWEKDALRYVLDSCSKITASVPCYDLGFVNNDRVVEFLKRELKEAK